MSSQITHLLLLDISSRIVRFNRLNIELLKAKSLEEYKKLRWSSNFSDWTEFVKKSKKLGILVHLSKEDYRWWDKHVRDLDAYQHFPLPEMLNRFGRDILVDRFVEIKKKLDRLTDKLVTKATRDQLYYEASFKEWSQYFLSSGLTFDLTKEDWKWWKKYVGDKTRWAYAQDWLENPGAVVDLGRVIDFKSGNYLYRSDLYEKLHTMAVQDRISAFQIDLSLEKNVQLLVSALKTANIPVAVLDLDNSWDAFYIGEKKYLKIVLKFQEIGKSNSILLVMNNFKNYGTGQFSIYIGFQFGNVRLWPEHFHLPELFSNTARELMDLMNGRLFEVGEMPVFF
jgi:hypothetical protein